MVSEEDDQQHAESRHSYSRTRSYMYRILNYRMAGISISQKNATIGLVAISLLVLIWLLSGIFWWTLASSGFLVAVHALLRDASMHQDTGDRVDMVGEVAGETSAFLGSNNV
jgi:hypothetical protein